MRLYFVHNKMLRYAVTCISLCFIFSFGMHALQIAHGHAHFGVHDTHEDTTPQQVVIDEYMHPSDKKYLSVLLEATLLLFFTISVHHALTELHTHITVQGCRRLFSERIGRATYFIVLLLRRGVLNTKRF